MGSTSSAPSSPLDPQNDEAWNLVQRMDISPPTPSGLTSAPESPAPPPESVDWSMLLLLSPQRNDIHSQDLYNENGIEVNTMEEEIASSSQQPSTSSGLPSQPSLSSPPAISPQILFALQDAKGNCTRIGRTYTEIYPQGNHLRIHHRYLLISNDESSSSSDFEHIRQQLNQLTEEEERLLQQFPSHNFQETHSLENPWAETSEPIIAINLFDVFGWPLYVFAKQQQEPVENVPIPSPPVELQNPGQEQGEEKEVAIIKVKIKLPVKSIAEWDRLETLVKYKSVVSQVKEHLEKIGGKNWDDCLRRILKGLMDHVRRGFNWCGRKGKRAFGNSNLQPIIFDAVRTSYPMATDYQLKQVAQRWLKQL